MIEKKTSQADEASPSVTPDAQDPLNVPMDQVITKTPKIEGSHTQETIDPAERLSDDPEEQNDLA
ncbi:hypothetical protein FPV16_23410 [Methylobacterium sp. W2]|uniref:hypothetical protein n=1 Tax=Methylobacterium sp. W2 TaxID=2598107 RepID=UPI001D0BFFF9|nr:hypothetical protein [Methylobacterium sp. W2]MCC0809111.1 hypothetical protein [Methylobacterium sp. W2]